MYDYYNEKGIKVHITNFNYSGIITSFVLPNKKDTIRIGIAIGTAFEETIIEDNPNAEISYFNLESDLPVALENNKIDVFAVDEVAVEAICKEHSSLYSSQRRPMGSYGFIVNLKNDKLQKELNKYIISLKESGLLQTKKIWTGSDETKKVVDKSNLTGENGTLVFATSSAVGRPFGYMMSDELIED